MEKLKNWFTTTLPKSIITNWSELLATLLAFYGYKTHSENFPEFIFGLAFFVLAVYWVFYRLLGFDVEIKRYIEKLKNKNNGG